MTRITQAEKAKAFLALHHDRKLLVLPNVWDAMGARLLEGLGYPAVATASAAVAYSRGLNDGQKLPFPDMLETVAGIASAVDVPVTADLEAGYGDTPAEVADHVRAALGAGVVGVNLEDSNFADGSLYSIADQQSRLRAVRDMANEEGIPLVINARTDVFIRGGLDPTPEKISETTARTHAYVEAGADCVYPILLSDLDALGNLARDTGAPLNVYASAAAPSIQELEAIGVRRLSLGPGFLKASLTTMRDVARSLLKGGSYEAFTRNVITNDEIETYLIRSQDKDA